MSDASGWFALFGVAAGVVATGTFGVVTARMTHRWSEADRDRADQMQGLRLHQDRLRDASHAYLVATNRYYQACDQMYRRNQAGQLFDPYEHARDAMTAMQDAYVTLTITAGGAVRRLARAYNMVLYDFEVACRDGQSDDEWCAVEVKTHAARNDVRAAMRDALGVSD